LRNRTVSRAGGAVVNRRCRAIKRERGLVRTIRYRVEIFLPVASAKLELMSLPHPRIVLFDAVELRELAAWDDAVILNAVVAEVLQEWRAVDVEGIRRAEFRGDILLGAFLIQAVLPVDQRSRAHSFHK